MKVSNMTSSRGNAVPNQFVITTEGRGALGNFTTRKVFQSYNSIIAEITVWPDTPPRILFDSDKWDYSRTTSKYRNQFTGLTTAQTKAGIADGSIKLVNLN